MCKSWVGTYLVQDTLFVVYDFCPHAKPGRLARSLQRILKLLLPDSENISLKPKHL